MPDHLRLDVDGRELLAIVDMDRLAPELGQHRNLSPVGPNGSFGCSQPSHESLLLGVQTSDVCPSGPCRQKLDDLRERKLQQFLHRVPAVCELLLPAGLDLALLLPQLPSCGL